LLHKAKTSYIYERREYKRNQNKIPNRSRNFSSLVRAGRGARRLALSWIPSSSITPKHVVVCCGSNMANPIWFSTHGTTIIPKRFSFGSYIILSFMIRCAGIKGNFSINSCFPHPSLARDLSCGLVQPWSSRRTGACKEDGEEKVFCRRPRCFLLILHGRPVGSIMYRTFYIERPRLVGAAGVPVSSEYMICSHWNIIVHVLMLYLFILTRYHCLSMHFIYARTYLINFFFTSNPPHFRSESAVSYMFLNANSIIIRSASNSTKKKIEDMVKAKCNPVRIVIVGQNIYIYLSQAVTLKLIIFWPGMEIVKVKRISEYI
jgi:hypothetical protein